jgi:uncharacterized membrane protein YqjE
VTVQLPQPTPNGGILDPQGALPGSVHPAPDATLGELVATASKDLSLLIRGEVELAKAELAVTAKSAAAGAALGGAAALFGAIGGLFALLTVAEALDVALPRWAAFLIVTAVLLLLAGVLGLGALTRIKKVGPPERTMTTVKDDIAWLKSPRLAPTRRSGSS